MDLSVITDHPPLSTPVAAGDSIVAECKDRYLTNMAALYRVAPALATEIEAVPFEQLPTFEQTRDGRLTCQLEADDGRSVYIHSKYRPLDEARTFVEAIETGDVSAVAVAGLGLGYHLTELDRCFDRPLLIVTENDLRLVKAALCCTDCSRMISEGRLLLLTSSDKATMHEQLYTHQSRMLLGMRCVSLPHSKRRGAAFQTQCSAQLNEFVAYARLQMMTILHNSRITCKNIAFNLKAYLTYDGIDDLRDRAKGLPAIVVAAGPSLARALPRLRELRSRAVIIAVQTVFKPLLAHGCPPHFVTSLDFAEVSANFFRGVDDLGGAMLVAEPKATWHVVDAYRGEKRMVHSRWADDMLQDAAPPRAPIKAGSTVAQLAFYLAQHLGCDPIILVGLDLAYSEGLYYAPGMPIERVWEPEMGRFSTLETKQWERVCRGKKLFRVVKDVHGRDVYTDEQLFTYAQQFQSDFLTSPARVVHAGESGMRLDGTLVCSLNEAAERFCTRELPGDLFRRTKSVARPASVERAVAELERRNVELRGIREICTEMVELIGKLERLVERPVEFNRLVVRVDELRNLMQRYDRTYHMVVGVSPTAELRRYAADRRIGDVQQETARTARMRLARDREFVAALIDGCDYLLEMLPQAALRVREGAS